MLAYNYRLPNLNAALACAQLEQLDTFLENKRKLAEMYKNFFDKLEIKFIQEPKYSYSNYWLNAILLTNKKNRDEFLEYSNNNGVITRPLWKLINKLKMYKGSQTTNLENSLWLEERLVTIPSSVRM